uniref:Pentatricopeptide repeat-containing protein n=1 Tax=Kalanchoe fedtschenkoi TaxID=63787 RepID=A0A7N0URG0_KALFE
MRFPTNLLIRGCVLRRFRKLNANPSFRIEFVRLFSEQSWLSEPGNPIINWPSPVSHSIAAPDLDPHPPVSSNLISTEAEFSESEFTAICDLLRNPSVSPGAELEAALDESGIKPVNSLLEAVFENFDSSPKLLLTLFQWAEKQAGFRAERKLFNTVVNAVCKARDFDSAWMLVLKCLDGDEQQQPEVVLGDTFAIMIRRYCRAGVAKSAIRTYQFACTLGHVSDSVSNSNLFEILLDALCKEGLVKVASEYVKKRRAFETTWVPSIRIYNILLNGWFRSRKLKHAERLWAEMKEDGVKPSVVTYGTLVEGYCRMRRVEIANELVKEMRREGIEPNAVVYNPVVDALGEAGRFKEAMGMLERFLVTEPGPTLSTYNSLVKGFCKGNDLVGASKVLKMMISRGFIPTATTYNYFFRYFMKFRKVEEGMNLYTKMIHSGHTPDRLTYHQILKMLCEEERLALALQVSKEMRARGLDLDLATSTMLVHLLCKMHKFDDAFAETMDMFRRGVVPQYLTFLRLGEELKRQGMSDKLRELNEKMASVPHSTKLPDSFVEDKEASYARRSSIIKRANVMSDILKDCRDPRELMRRRGRASSKIENEEVGET